MAEDHNFITPDAIAEEVNLKTVEVYISIPGLETKWKVPLVGTSELKSTCDVESAFNKESLTIIATVKKTEGVENKYRYTVQKLPGQIIPTECSTKYKDGQIILVLKKAESSSWEVPLQRGLEQAKK